MTWTDRPATATPQLTPTASTWAIEDVDTPKLFQDMGDRSLALDTAGRPHIAYGADHLYYAWYDGSNWNLEMADDAQAQEAIKKLHGSAVGQRQIVVNVAKPMEPRQGQGRGQSGRPSHRW